MKRWVGVFACWIVVLALVGCGGGGSGDGNGGGGGVAPSISVQPVNQTVTAGQTATFSVTATGTAPLSYQWINAATSANISGATSSSYTTPATTLADNGNTYRVVVSNASGATDSLTATLTVNASGPPPPSGVKVLTYHNDNSRTGQNLSETTLTPANVGSAQFDMLGTITVDGPVDAEPLFVGGMTINGVMHNVLFVVTENDSVYAFDADTFAQIWQNPLLSGTGESPSDDRGCSQVDPTIGVTSTPVIDLNAGPNGTIFVVAMSKSGSTYHQRLHALDLATGTDRMTATDIQASAAGTGTGSAGGTQTFDPSSYEERAALLLSNGVIYTTWTSHCDHSNYTSWVISFTESSLQKAATLNLTANGGTQGGQEGGIWMSGDGPAADSSGNVYFLVGNGTFDTTLSSGFPNHCDFGNSFMKISTSGTTCTGSGLGVVDYFAMDNASGTAETESSGDTDLGSGGEMLLPDLGNGQNIHLAVGAGKDGNLYVVNRDNMGKFASSDIGIYQELLGALGSGVWSAPAYFNNAVYYGPQSGNLLAFPISNAMLSATPSKTGVTFQYPGATPSISANGSSDGIVWAVQNGSSGTKTLYAFDATNLSDQLFSGNFSGSASTKFITPMIANGKVYVGTGATSGKAGTVVVFGLTNQGTQLIRRPKTHEQRRFLRQPRAPRAGSSTPGF